MISLRKKFSFLGRLGDPLRPGQQGGPSALQKRVRRRRKFFLSHFNTIINLLYLMKKLFLNVRPSRPREQKFKLILLILAITYVNIILHRQYKINKNLLAYANAYMHFHTSSHTLHMQTLYENTFPLALTYTNIYIHDLTHIRSYSFSHTTM